MIGVLVRPLRRSLRARLVAYFLLLSSVTVLVVGLVVYARATDDLTTSVFDRLGAVAETKADALDRWIDEQSRNVVFVGVMPGVGDDARTLLDGGASSTDRQAVHDRLTKVLSTVVRQTSDAQELMILDLEGTVRLSTRSASEGASQANEPFFERGVSHTTVQNVYASGLTGLPTITVATPLFDQDGIGQRVGVLAANLSLERIDRIVLERTGLGQSGQTYLVGRDRRFVHARLDQGAGSLVSSAAIEAALSGQDGRAVYVDYRGSPVIGVYRWLEEHEAAMIAEMSQDEAFAPARQLALTIALVGLASATLLTIGIWLIARRVTRPILALAAVAARVRGGDLEASAMEGAEDEVGTLAVAFNEMTAQLRENVQTLERRVEERTAELTTALEAQREAEQRYRRLVEELPLAVYLDPPGDSFGASLYVSPRIEMMFGYPADDWYRDDFFASIIDPSDYERVISQAVYAHNESDHASGEYRIVAKDGRQVWVRDDNVLVRDDGGQPKYTLGFFIDVTQQALAEAEVRRQKSYFESLVEISPVAVVTMDRNERVSGWNPAATRLFKFSPDEAIGQRIDDLVLRSDALQDEGRDVTREADETGRAHRISRRLRKDGEFVDVEIVMVPLAVDGERTGYYVIYHDITELQAARREADAANQAKSTFLAAMSHEIRTPMNAIIGMSGLLVDTPLSDEQRDYADTIRTSGDALLGIINDILDFSKIEAGRVELEAEPFPLAGCVEGALDVLAPTAAKKGLELAYAIDDDLPAAIVGDAGRLRQIVLNLLSNAVKFTDRGEVVLSVGGQPVEAADGPPETGPDRDRWEIRIDVRDTGLGITPDRMSRLFQSFSQADASIARRYGGTGLGLAISRRLAELMDGSLTAESSGVAGEGSVFRLVIQANAASAVEAIPAPVADLAGRRVLVVDDNATNRRILVAQTGRWGMVARETGSPIEALGWVRDGERFDIALVDLNMPELDGVALARAVRAACTDRPVPVLVLSSVGERDREAPGVAAWLVKPIKPSALHDALVGALAGLARPIARPKPARPTIDPGLGARHPLRILLAEDNAVNQKLALRLLEKMGYRADVAATGVEAIEALGRATYDLVLMDVQMPEMDGLEATRRIVARPASDARPWIVAMTANAMEGDREACLAAGMNDYVSKPIRPAELAAALERAASSRPMKAASG